MTDSANDVGTSKVDLRVTAGTKTSLAVERLFTITRLQTMEYALCHSHRESDKISSMLLYFVTDMVAIPCVYVTVCAELANSLLSVNGYCIIYSAQARQCVQRS